MDSIGAQSGGDAGVAAGAGLALPATGPPVEAAPPVLCLPSLRLPVHQAGRRLAGPLTSLPTLSPRATATWIAAAEGILNTRRQVFGLSK